MDELRRLRAELRSLKLAYYTLKLAMEKIANDNGPHSNLARETIAKAKKHKANY
jgi:hypothetical protein